MTAEEVVDRVVGGLNSRFREDGWDALAFEDDTGIVVVSSTGEVYKLIVHTGTVEVAP